MKTEVRKSEILLGIDLKCIRAEICGEPVSFKTYEKREDGKVFGGNPPQNRPKTG